MLIVPPLYSIIEFLYLIPSFNSLISLFTSLIQSLVEIMILISSELKIDFDDFQPSLEWRDLEGRGFSWFYLSCMPEFGSILTAWTHYVCHFGFLCDFLFVPLFLPNDRNSFCIIVPARDYKPWLVFLVPHCVNPDKFIPRWSALPFGSEPHESSWFPDLLRLFLP